MNIIELQDVTFCWPHSAATVIDIERFSLKRGEKLFISGASGSGKSTLLGLLSGILTPSSGSINILQAKFTALSDGQRDQFRADHIGYIFQQFNLIPYLSVIENVLLPCLFSQKRRDQLSNNATEHARQLVSSLKLPETCINRPVTQLSIGQQQRVAAARALIGNPELVIADEPTSALDTHNRQAFIELLMNQCALTGASLLFVSHDQQLQPLFDRHLALSEINDCEEPANEYL